MVKWERSGSPHPMVTIRLRIIAEATMLTGKQTSQSSDGHISVYGATNKIEARDKERQLYIHQTDLLPKLLLCKLCWRFKRKHRNGTKKKHVLVHKED